jgi:hypothetical protein
MKDIYHSESPEEQRARLHRELLSRLSWAHPEISPIEHMRSPEWCADVASWYRLGRKERA